MANKTDLWGQDIALDTSGGGMGQAIVTAAGELALTQGVETGIQDIKYRILTRLGTLFYDKNFGSLVHDWVLEENTGENRMSLEAELVIRLEQDPRVKFGSVSAKVVAWDDKKLIVQLSWEFTGEANPFLHIHPEHPQYGQKVQPVSG